MRVLLFVSALLLPAALFAQSTGTTTATQDPQAVSVLNQAVSAGGGLTALKTLADYTGSGSITYHGDQDVQASVTIQGLGLDEFRLDADLPSGQRSWGFHSGQTALKAENGNISKFPPDYQVPSSDAFPYQPPLFPSSVFFPYPQLLAVLNNSQFSVSYKGVVTLNGRSVHDVQVQLLIHQPDPMSEYQTKDFFVDASTFQIVMTQESVPRHVIHQILYSAYAVVNGILTPLSIGEVVDSQHTWDIQLSQISFNSGLQDSAFVIQ